MDLNTALLGDRRALRLVGAALCLLAMGEVARAETAELVPSRNPKESVKQLEFDSSELEVKRGESGPMATVNGKLDKPGWTLRFEGEEIVSADGDREFSRDILLSGRVTQVQMQVENTKGQQKTIKFIIRFEDYSSMAGAPRGKGRKAKASKAESEPKPSGKPKAFQVNLGASFTSVTYSEENTGAASGNVNLSMSAATLKGGASYAFSENWDAGLSAYYTLLPFGTTITATLVGVADTDTARLLGINMRVGYRLGFVKAPSSLKLMFGWYYTTMMVTNASFGFTSMAGPQLYPVFSTKVSAKNSLVFYAKFSPIIGALSLDNREIAGGGAFVMEMSNGNTLSFTADIANIGFVLTQNSTSSTVSSTSFSGGLAFGF